MKNTIILTAMLLTFCSALFAQSPENMAKAREAEQSAQKAYQDKAFSEYLAQMKLANAARPNHPRLIYNLASAYALGGNPDEAMSALERLGKMGLSFAVEKDDDFRSILETERFSGIRSKFRSNDGPILNSSTGFTVPDKTLIAEGVAHDPRSGNFYVGSFYQRKIVRIDKNGIASDLSRDSDGLWSVFGIRVDAERRILWVCTAAMPQMRGFDAADKGRSGIFKYDLRTGRLLKKYILPDGTAHVLGDLEIGPDGTVYATDSMSPVIYTINAKRDTIEEFLRSDDFASLQGVAFAKDGRQLYAADYSKGIFRIDMASKKIVQLTPADSITLLGIDGLYLYRGTLIGIQNGVRPNRVIAFTINGDTISAQKVLEANNPNFIEPTLGVMAGDELYFNANGQMAFVNNRGILDEGKMRLPLILRMNVKKALAR